MSEATRLADPQPDLRPHKLNRGFAWRDAPREGRRRLSPDQVRRYDEDGFFVFPGAFSAEEIAAVTAAIDPLEAAEAARVETDHGGRHGVSQTGAISFTTHLVTRSPVLADFARHRVLRDICYDLLGPDVRLYWDQSVYKKPEIPREFPWHQDNGYTFVEPQQYLTLWIPLVDVDETNGCPWIAPGVHRMGALRHRWTDIGFVCFDDEPADARPAPARAGDIVVFSSLSPHRTGPNLREGQVRKAYILQYAPDGVIAHYRDGTSRLQNDPDRQFPILVGGR